MEETLWKFVMFVLVAAIGVLVPVAVKWINAKANEIKAGLSAEQAIVVNEVVNAVVRAAEQANVAGLIEDKKLYALNIGEKWLAQRGIKIDLDVLSAAIEEAVWSSMPHEERTNIPF